MACHRVAVVATGARTQAGGPHQCATNAGSALGLAGAFQAGVLA